MMIEGIHPSQTRYQYPEGRDLISWGAENLAEIDVEGVAAFLAAANTLIVERGGIIASRTSAGSYDDGSRLPIGDPAHLAPSVGLAITALEAIPCEDLDYDDWIRVTCAFKAATGGTIEAYTAYVEWCLAYLYNDEDVADAKWESVADSALGWNWLCAKAAEWEFEPAAHLFEELEDVDGGPNGNENADQCSTSGAEPEYPGQEDTDGSGDAPKPPGTGTPTGVSKPERWEKRYAYIEPLKEFVDLKSPNLQRYDLQAFKLKHPLFDPWKPRSNAVMRYLRSPHKTVCQGYTYLPSRPRIVDEAGRRLLNRWSPGPALLERNVTDDEIGPWLEHVEYIIANRQEREIFLDWLAHLVQGKQPKSNFAVLIGGEEGIGKKPMIEPIIAV